MSWPRGLPEHGFRVSTLLNNHVVDCDGDDIGKVHDIETDADWTVRCLLVSRRALFERLGLMGHHPRTPALIRLVSPHGHHVDWSVVERVEDGVIHLGVKHESLHDEDTD